MISKKIIILILIALSFLFITPTVNAETDIRIRPNCSGKLPQFSAIWNDIPGTKCEVKIIAGNNHFLLKNTACSGVETFSGNIDSSKTFSSDENADYGIYSCSTFQLCVRSDKDFSKCSKEETVPDCKRERGIDSCMGRDLGPPPGGAVDKVFGRIKAPDFIEKIGFGAGGINQILNTLVVIIYVVAGVVAVFMVIFSALEFITSGGDKEKVAGARKRLTYAIIGLVILGLAGVLIYTLGQILGFELFRG